MRPQNFERENKKILDAFMDLMKNKPEKTKKRIKLSWSNWGFGMEPLEDSLKRLNDSGISFIELHGNHYGADLGYDTAETKKILSEYNIKVSGICGMFSAESELSSNSPAVRQRAIDYTRRNLELGQEFGAKYFLVVPGAVGRPTPYDDMEFDRSVATLRLVADDGELWLSDMVAVHILPKGTSVAAAWEFNTNLDKEGWTEVNPGTRVRQWPNPDWPGPPWD